jgi:hypothetical protein
MGNNFLGGYEKQAKKPNVLDLNVSGLGEHMNIQELKKSIGAKHVIAATIE